MSRIQATFSAIGRQLLDSEKPAVEAFKTKYGNRNTVAASAQQRPPAEREAQPRRATDRLAEVVGDRVVIRRELAGGGTLVAVVGQNSNPAVALTGKDSKRKMALKFRASKRRKAATAVAAAVLAGKTKATVESG